MTCYTVWFFTVLIVTEIPFSVSQWHYTLNNLLCCEGHGGDGFLKFQDAEEVSSVELADAFEQMWQKRRYHELLFMVDTCQAESMLQRFYSPNLLGVASSRIGEDSLSVGTATLVVYSQAAGAPRPVQQTKTSNSYKL